MHISFHIGAHATDDDQLIKSLLKNPDALSEQGVMVPGPSRYRGPIRDAVAQLRGEPASEETEDALLDTILDAAEPERFVLSSNSFLCTGDKAIMDGMLYPRAAEKTRWLRNLFPSHKVEFFIAIRNLATFIPAIVKRNKSEELRQRVLALDPEVLVWSDVIRDIREANPDCPLTVWCNEDTPMIWPEVMHEVSGIDPQVQFMGGFDILNKIMAREGIKRLRAYLAEHPPQNEIQRRRVLSAFLDKYALDEEVEDEVDLPGWTADLVERLTQVYEDDLIEIGRLPGVTLLTA